MFFEIVHSKSKYCEKVLRIINEIMRRDGFAVKMGIQQVLYDSRRNYSHHHVLDRCIKHLVDEEILEEHKKVDIPMYEREYDPISRSRYVHVIFCLLSFLRSS